MTTELEARLLEFVEKCREANKRYNKRRDNQFDARYDLIKAVQEALASLDQPAVVEERQRNIIAEPHDGGSVSAITPMDEFCNKKYPTTSTEAGTPATRLERLLSELAKRFPSAEQPLSSSPPETRFIQAIDTLLDTVAVEQIDERNEWVDLWYFVMDEAPMEFEKIVTTYSPNRWHCEAHKLMRSKRPISGEKK